MVTIYCLELEQNKYYVGKTNNFNIRISNHFLGDGSLWTKKYKPISVLYVKHNCDAFDEDKHTKMLMAEYGIENVRGGSYSQEYLSEKTKEFIMNEIRGSTDMCFRCGKPGHFVKECEKFTDNNEFVMRKIQRFRKKIKPDNMMISSKVIPLVFAVSASEAVGQTLAFLSIQKKSNLLFGFGWFAYLAVLYFLTLSYKFKGIGYINVMWSGMTSVIMLTIGHLVFKERMSTMEWIGIFLVVVGVIVMSIKHN